MLVIGIPILFLRFTLDPFNVPKLSLLAAGVSLVLGIKIIEITQGARWREGWNLVVPGLLLATPLVLSWLFSPYRSWSLFGIHPRFQGLVPYLLVIVFGFLLADAFKGRASEIAYALCWAGAVVGAYTVIQVIGMDPFDWTLLGAPTEAVATTGNPNFTGGFLGITMPLAMSFVLHDPGRRRIVLRLLVVIALGWVLARSQGGWAAGVAGSAIVLGQWLRDRFRMAALLGLGLAAAVAVAVVGYVVFAMVNPDSRLTASAAIVRGRWWQAAVGMGFDHPIVGRGPNSFTIEGVSHRPVEDAVVFGFDFPNDPHSVPLAMFANLGVLGFLGFVGLLAWLLWRYYVTDGPAPIQVAFFAAAIAYFVQSLVSIDEPILRVGLWTALAGFVASGLKEEDAAPRPSGRPSARKTSKPKSRKRAATEPMRRPWAVAAAGLAALAGVISSGIFLTADALARQGTGHFALGDYAEGRQTYEDVLSLRNSADYQARLAFLLRRAALDDDDVDSELAEAASAAFSFTEEVPYVFSIVTHARFLEEVSIDQRTSDPRVVDLYRRAIEIDPLNPIIRIETARALLRRAEPTAALETLYDMRDAIGRGRAEYWGLLALSAAEAGEAEIAGEALEVADSLDPAQADAAEARELLEGAPRN